MKKVILLLILAIGFGGCSAPDFRAADETIQDAIEDRIFPGAVLLVGDSEKILYEKAYGKYTYAADAKKVTPASLFDLASLTKVFATSMSVMKCIDSGLVDPEAYVVEYLPEFDNNGKDHIRVKHLLLHNSGLPAYETPADTPEKTLERIMQVPMTQELGEYKYSCLNFITLMRVVEAASGKKMRDFYREHFTEPMELKNTFFAPPPPLREKCLPTAGDSSGTEILLQGVVHDPLARSLEGYSGNAGLFSTASELSAFCRLIMNDGMYEGCRYVREATVQPFVTLQANGRCYGWSVNGKGSAAGSRMSATAIGHTGYTGTCAWIDRENDVFVILLTNRVYPLDQKAVNPVRRAVNDAVMKALSGA
ncbi:MAG: serine hydrolase domain-containing protein [Candidatus Marinimicrobia bacterium]|nr:serine hydrolase domain-containing protein [Candidatus Neomarinimicrobiota bacterium]